MLKNNEWWKDLKKGDYFVVTKSSAGYNGQLNHIYKAEKDIYAITSGSQDFRIQYETGGGCTIGLQQIGIRSATQEEIAMYNHAGKPVDVTTYKIPEEKHLTLKDLVEGEYYYGKGSREHIFIYKNSSKRIIDFKEFTIDTYDNLYYACLTNLRFATPEERQWLDACIAKGKFIEKDEALKDEEEYKVGDWVYATKQSDDDWRKDKFVPIFQIQEISQQFWLRPEKGRSEGVSIKHCRKATPEEIQKAQGYPEQKEFVLPEKWCVKSTDEADPILKEWRGCGYGSRPAYLCSGKYWMSEAQIKGYTEITLEQFKKYVLKEESSFPEKWVIKQNASQKVCDWFRKKFNTSAHVGGGYTYLKYGDNYVSNYAMSIPDGYVEITVEQFEKHVLKEQVEPIKEKEVVNNDPLNLIGKSFQYEGIGTVYTFTLFEKDRYEVSWGAGKTTYAKDKADELITNGKWILMSSKKDVREELLEEAKRRYPVGTTFKVAHNPSGICKVKSHDRYSSTFVGSIPDLHINFLSETIETDDEDDDCEGASVYFNGRWAEVIASSSKKDKIIEEAKQRYPVGSKFKDLVNGHTFTVASHVFDTFGDKSQLYVAVDPLKGVSNKTARVYKNGTWATIISSPEEDTITQAKKMYPVGTKFVPAHVGAEAVDEYSIVTNTNFKKTGVGDIIALTDEGKDYDKSPKYGNHNYNRIVYDGEAKKWTKIIATPQEKDKIICYDGLTIGDKLPYDIISEWGAIGRNWICLGNKSPVWKKSGKFISDRTILSFKEFNGEMTFLVSGTMDVHMRAKGFKAFMDSYKWQKTETWDHTIIDMTGSYTFGIDPCEKKPSELILKEDDEIVIFPNIKREKVVEIKIKLVD